MNSGGRVALSVLIRRSSLTGCAIASRLGKPMALVAATLLAALAILGWHWMRAHGLDGIGLTPEAIEAFVKGWGPWSAVGSMLLMALHSFLPLPAEIIAFANGMMFGPVWGVVVTWIGAMLGGVLAFALARGLGRPFVRRMVSEKRWNQIETLSARPSSLLLVRLIPVISFNLVNYAAGLLGVSWWTFLWTTAIGILPLTAGMVVLGRELLMAPRWAWVLVGAGLLASWLALRWLRPNRRSI